MRSQADVTTMSNSAFDTGHRDVVGFRVRVDDYPVADLDKAVDISEICSAIGGADVTAHYTDWRR
jgi:hypothetical protein